MNLIFISPPGGGKGTISSLLNKNFNLVTISAGQLLRDVDPNTEMGKKIREVQEKGQLVDNRITSLLLKQRLQKDDVKNGFILDGFPREIPQVESLNEISEQLEFKIDYVIYLNVPFEVACNRILGRLTCPKCKEIYNTLTGLNKPKVNGKCNNCGIDLESRNDDNEESLKARFKLFEEITFKVIDYYRNKNILIEVDGNNSPEEVYNEIINKIGLYDKY